MELLTDHMPMKPGSASCSSGKTMKQAPHSANTVILVAPDERAITLDHLTTLRPCELPVPLRFFRMHLLTVESSLGWSIIQKAVVLASANERQLLLII